MSTLDHYADPERKLEELISQRDELAALLKEARSLGLNFDIGNAYIRRAYITAQDDLRARIKVALEKVGAA